MTEQRALKKPVRERPGRAAVAPRILPLEEQLARQLGDAIGAAD